METTSAFMTQTNMNTVDFGSSAVAASVLLEEDEEVANIEVQAEATCESIKFQIDGTSLLPMAGLTSSKIDVLNKFASKMSFESAQRLVNHLELQKVATKQNDTLKLMNLGENWKM